MTLLLHAIAEAGPPRQDNAAADPASADRPLRWIPVDRLGVWATAWAGQPALTREDMLEHHRLVEALCAAAECLPVRFGSWVDDEAAARQTVAARESPLLEALARVRGRRELALTFVWTTPAPALGAADSTAAGADAPEEAVGPAGAGTRYLAQRRRAIEADDARRARAAELTRLVERKLGVAEVDARHRIAPSERVALSSALLVPRDEADQLAARARELAADLPDVELLVNGPWPPYSFATVD